MEKFGLKTQSLELEKSETDSKGFLTKTLFGQTNLHAFNRPVLPRSNVYIAKTAKLSPCSLLTDIIHHF